MTTDVSHALVLPDTNFDQWLAVTRAYTKKFARTAIVRSPRGVDLNRYRTVSAVATPQTWLNDDPVAHIRRIYPQVVRVDVLYATTPAELTTILQERITTNDRYGEKQVTRQHLFERFILEYPTAHRPMRIVGRFKNETGIDKDNEGLDFATTKGAKVLAGARGIVTRLYNGNEPDQLRLGRYVQVSTTIAARSYTVTYGNLGTLRATFNQRVQVGDVLGEAAGDRIKILVQQSDGGLPDMRLPNVIDPTALLYVQDFRVRPTGTGLRVRTLPSTEGQVLAMVNPWETLEALELHGRALGKIGVQDEWVKVKLPDGREGHAAAWFLEATVKGNFFDGVNPVGINLDALHPLGTPDAARLGEMGWVRFGYNVSNNSGSEDIAAAYNRYAPLAERYTKAGYKVLFATSHQTYGEGKNEFWPWNAMTDDKWNTLSDRFAEMMQRISQQWAGKGLVHCWQIWNEQDAHQGAAASVPMSPRNYANLLTKTIRAIRTHDREVFIITGGHTGGPGNGSNYAAETIRNMPAEIRPDGIACHPYGRGPDPKSPYAIFGHIDDELQAYLKVLPGRPVWLTEWGVLDRGGDNPSDIATYALQFINYVKAKYSDRVAVLLWYAWAETMHNGYGIVDAQNNVRNPLTERFLQA
jgi:hypothetical protein